MGLLQGGLVTHFAEARAVDPDRGPAINVADDGKYLEWIAARSDRLHVFPIGIPLQARHLRTWRRLLHPRCPPVEILAVPDRSPAVLGASHDTGQQYTDD